VELPKLSSTQVLELAQLHQLDWNETQVAQLTDMVGGHPYLVRVALYHIAHGETTLEQLLKQAPTPAGVYGRHLLRHWESLKQTPKLTEIMKKIARSSTPVQVDPTHADSLDSLGLIEHQGNGVIPSCNLYRQYFS
jgi:serine/threonine-protein kinase